MPCRIRSVSLPSRRRTDAWEARWIASAASSLWACGPNGVLPGPPGATSRAGTRGRLVASCRTVAGIARCVALAGSGSRAVAPWWLAFGRQVPRGRRENCVYGQSALRSPDNSGSRLRGCPRAGGRRRPRYAFVSHALAACGHAPEPRTGAPVQASVRRASEVARTGRVQSAARDGAGLVAGEIIGEFGGVWQRLAGGAGESCANAGVARARYVGRCGAPSHSGGARPGVSRGRWSRDGAVVAPPLRDSGTR